MACYDFVLLIRLCLIHTPFNLFFLTHGANYRDSVSSLAFSPDGQLSPSSGRIDGHMRVGQDLR